MYVRRWQIQPSDDSKLVTGNPAFCPGTLVPGTLSWPAVLHIPVREGKESIAYKLHIKLNS